MKKTLCLVLAILGFSVYALPWEDASNKLMKFFDGGNAVYIAENKYNLLIIPKNNIRRVKIDEDDFEIIISEDEKEEGYNFTKGKHNISLDNNLNLIITK
ncbi:MAG TPA: hypothetical protein DCF70_01790 [Treponema sp.]|nr:hypothetical protein [Treponema sp.]